MTINYKKIISTFLVFVLAVVTGFAIGKLYLDQNIPALPPDKTRAELYATDDEISTLIQRVQAGEEVLDFDGVQLWQIAEYNLFNAPRFRREMWGNVNSARFNLKLRSIKVKENNVLTYTKLSPPVSISPTICTKVIYDYNKPDQIEVINKGSFKDTSVPARELEGVFPAKGDMYTQEAFYNIFKALPDESILPYIISYKTCPKDSGIVGEVVDNEDGTYTFEIHLSGTNLDDAALYYSYEILFSSGYSFPTWNRVDLKVTIDENFLFRNITYHEQYKVSNVPVLGTTNVIDDFQDEFLYGDELEEVAA